jgi:hypothetical protein
MCEAWIPGRLRSYRAVPDMDQTEDVEHLLGSTVDRFLFFLVP